MIYMEIEGQHRVSHEGFTSIFSKSSKKVQDMASGSGLRLSHKAYNATTGFRVFTCRNAEGIDLNGNSKEVTPGPHHGKRPRELHPALNPRIQPYFTMYLMYT